MAERNWHILFTKPGKEKKVAGILAKRKIDCYLPEYKSETVIDGRRKVVSGPLFPRFVFIAAESPEASLLKESRHILNFMYWKNEPVQVKQEEIAAMKEFLDEYTCTRLDKAEVTPGAYHRINNEIQLVRKGSVVEANIGTVRLTIPSIGHVLIAEIRKEKAEEFTLVKDSLIGSISGS